jgi:D-arabinose 1-dehydrogenase-like Zn-dependent alcohol dehydrogenase
VAWPEISLKIRIKMRCYCVLEHGKPLSLVDKPIPEPVGTEVVVRVRAAGLCHTDLHVWEGSYDLGGGKRMALADRGIKPPITLSHEISGEVYSVGPQALRARPGDAVLVHPWIGCGACAACERGEENICSKPQAIGIGRPGGFSDYVLVPHPRYLVDITGIPFAEAAPLACAGVTTYSALRKFGERLRTDPVVIIGAGGLGLMALSILKAMDGKGAIVVDIDPVKRDAALAAGALQVIDARSPQAAEQMIAATGGGARAVLDLVGATSTVTLACSICARGGQVVICGLMGGDITLSLPFIPLRPLTLQGSYVGTVQELEALVALVRTRGVAPIPFNSRPLDQVNAALSDLAGGHIVGRTIMIP